MCRPRSYLATQREYRAIFKAIHGDLPHDCIFCGEPVEHSRPTLIVTARGFPWARALAIHHRNGEHKAHRPENLRAARWDCHSTRHNLERSATGTNPCLDSEI